MKVIEMIEQKIVAMDRHREAIGRLANDDTGIRRTIENAPTMEEERANDLAGRPGTLGS
jgi:hypothetical protein